MKIAAVQTVTLSDFPGKVAAIVFTRGCNFRCAYCHNHGLINMTPPPGDTDIDIESFISFLKSRKGKLNGLVISGGEPTMQNGLAVFIRQVKQLGLAVKLDTNGSQPEILNMLLEDGLLDYISMDIKAPSGKYNLVAGTPVQVKNILKSIDLIISTGESVQGFDYEFRTTTALSMLDHEDIISCGHLAAGARRFILQSVKTNNVLSPSALTLEAMAHRLRSAGIPAHSRTG